MTKRQLRNLQLAACAAACLLMSLALAACHKRGPLGPPWVQLDMTTEKPFVEATPPGISGDQVYQQRTAQVGTTTFHVIEQTTYSRVKWRVHVDDGSYVSFIPLGFEKPCDNCKFRMGTRSEKKGVTVLYESVAQAIPPAAPEPVKVSLQDFADEDVDLLFQIDGPPAAAAGQLPPSVLWANVALYSRQPQGAAAGH
jgi:hypothetical protein